MTGNRPTHMRKLLRILARGAACIVVLILVVSLYASLKMRWAKRQVEAFHGQVVTGMPLPALEAKAREMHLNYRPMTGNTPGEGKVVVWEGFAFGRWFCNVEYREGKVTGKRITPLD